MRACMRESIRRLRREPIERLRDAARYREQLRFMRHGVPGERWYACMQLGRVRYGLQSQWSVRAKDGHADDVASYDLSPCRQRPVHALDDAPAEPKRHELEHDDHDLRQLGSRLFEQHSDRELRR